MSTFLSLVVFAACIAFVVWLARAGPPSTTTPTITSDNDAFIDSSDSRQIGMLIGMTGGSIKDAAVARFALQRFEEIHGRKATNRDIGLLVGILNSMDGRSL